MSDLFGAIKKGDQAAVQALLKGGADPNTIQRRPFAVSLQLAVDQNVAMVELLCSYGANPNQTGLGGRPVIIMAAIKRKLDIVECLLRHGADINYCGEYGLTALIDYLGRKPTLATVQFLCERGADVNSVSTRSCRVTPFLAAAHSGNLEVCQYLQSRGANILAVAGNGNTALHRACEWNRSLPLIRYLCEQGLPIAAVNCRRQTAISLAAREGYLEIVHYLHLQGATLTFDLLHLALRPAGMRNDMETNPPQPIWYRRVGSHILLAHYLRGKGLREEPDESIPHMALQECCRDERPQCNWLQEYAKEITEAELHLGLYWSPLPLDHLATDREDFQELLTRHRRFRATGRIDRHYDLIRLADPTRAQIIYFLFLIYCQRTTILNSLPYEMLFAILTFTS